MKMLQIVKTNVNMKSAHLKKKVFLIYNTYNLKVWSTQ